MRCGIPGIRLRDDRINRIRALDSHELLIEAVVEVGAIVRIEAELVQDGGVEVFDVEAVFDCCGTEFVGLAVWMAGGGVKGSLTYGVTDDFGYGRDFRLTDVYGNVVTDIRVFRLDG